MYRIAICDDEPLFLRYLEGIAREVLTSLDAMFELELFLNGQDLIAEIQRDVKQFYLVFLDILMEPVNGIEVAGQIRRLGFKGGIVFITSTDSYLLEGYSAYPAQYLVKPVSREQLYPIIARDYRETYLPGQILIPILYGSALILLREILYLETLNRSTYIHIDNGYYEYPGTMRALSSLMPEGLFSRCHKSFTVSLGRISQITRSHIILDNGAELPVGRAYYRSVMEGLNDYLGTE